MHLRRAESVHGLNMNADCSRQVDSSHTSFAEAASDPVAVREGSRELGRDLGHGGEYDVGVALAMMIDQVGDGPPKTAPRGRPIGPKPEGIAGPYWFLKQL